MLVLALDTTTRIGSLALTRDGVVLEVYAGDRGPDARPAAARRHHSAARSPARRPRGHRSLRGGGRAGVVHRTADRHCHDAGTGAGVRAGPGRRVDIRRPAGGVRGGGGRGARRGIGARPGRRLDRRAARGSVHGAVPRASTCSTARPRSLRTPRWHAGPICGTGGPSSSSAAGRAVRRCDPGTADRPGPDRGSGPCSWHRRSRGWPSVRRDRAARPRRR